MYNFITYLIYTGGSKYNIEINTVTGLPLTTLLHLIRNYTQELDINHYITLD